MRAEEAAAEFRAHNADAAVVVAYGLILPVPILEAVPLGCFNLHASLLPRWRGAAPINRAIMAGDAESGVMVMQMEEGLDTGRVALAERVPIGADMTAGELHDALARLGADLMVRALGALERGTLQLTPQPDEGVTYATKIDKGETRIDWAQAVEAGPRPHPRAVAVSRRVVRASAVSAHQGAALDPRRGLGRARHCFRRPAHHRVRQGRGAAARGAARRQAADEGRGVPARRKDRPRNAIVVMVRPERAEDAVAVRALLIAAFPGTAEADLVERLRRNGDLALALVADNGGRVHGYAAFPKLTVEDAGNIHRRRRSCARRGDAGLAAARASAAR